MRSFAEYAKMVEYELMPKYGAVEHWAKVEVPGRDGEGMARLQQRMAERYPVQQFNDARARLDPKNILSNEIIDGLFPRDAVRA